MKFLLLLSSLMILTVACSSDPKEKYENRKQEAQEDYKETVEEAKEERDERLQEAEEEFRKEQKEEAKEYIDDSEGAELNQDEGRIKVIE